MQDATLHLGRAARPFPGNLTKAIAKKTLRVENEAQQISRLCRFLEAKLFFPQAVGGRMAYCPECGAEFHAEIRRCPECQVDLVEELDDPSLFDSQDENLVLIKSASSSDEAKRVKQLLERNGILCVVEEPRQSKSSPASGTMHVLVNQKDEPRSQEIINSHFK